MMDYDFYYLPATTIQIEYQYNQIEEQNYIMKLERILELYDFKKDEASNLIQTLNIFIPEDMKALENCKLYEELLGELNEILQKNFLRPKGSERQNMIDRYNAPEIREKILPSVSHYYKKHDEGLDEPWKLLLGSSEAGMIPKLEELVRLTEQGHKTEVIVPTGGKRELWLDREPSAIEIIADRLSDLNKTDNKDAIENVKKKKDEIFDKLSKMQRNHKNLDTDLSQEKVKEKQKEIDDEVKRSRNEAIKYFTDIGIIYPTETDMMELLIKNYKEKYPKLNKIEFKPTIDMPMEWNDKTKAYDQRPTTESNFRGIVRDYRKELEKEGSVGILSIQPYVTYQLEQAKTIFYKNDLKIESFPIAPESKDRNLTTLFDAVARTIYCGLPRVKDSAIELDYKENYYTKKYIEGKNLIYNTNTCQII